VEDAAQALKSAVNTTANSLFPDKMRIRYNGRIGASIRSVAGADLVQGVLGVRFIPAAAPNQELSVDERGSQVSVDDGEDEPSASFVVTVVSGSGLESYPRSRAVSVPIDETSETFEFTLVREQALTGELEVVGTAPAARSVLIDVSQAGRTVQLLELPITEMQGRDSIR
jgi:hypothetical protein